MSFNHVSTISPDNIEDNKNGQDNDSFVTRQCAVIYIDIHFKTNSLKLLSCK